MSTPQIPEVTVAEVPADAVLLDVREDDEWTAGHAPGAVHVPMTTLAERLDQVPDGEPVLRHLQIGRPVGPGDGVSEFAGLGVGERRRRHVGVGGERAAVGR